MGALVPGLVIVYQSVVASGNSRFYPRRLHSYCCLIFTRSTVLGTLVERFYGPRRSMGIYFLSLFGANVLVTLFSPWTVPTVGASGAIMGVLGAALCLFLALPEYALARQTLP